MGPTHIAVGVAAALALAQPQSAAACVVAAAGGLLGAAVCDVDAWASQNGRSVRRGALLVLVAFAALAWADARLGSGACAWLAAHGGVPNAVGLACFAASCLAGARLPHRSFAHSLLGLALMGGALYVACAPLVPGFAAGFASHVALDLLNYRPVRLLYPVKRGVSFGLYKADGVANAVLFAAGCAVAALSVYAALG